MPGDFLKALQISDEERTKLSKLSAKTPLALLAMRKASRDAFDEHVGRDRAEAIAKELENLLTDEDRESLSKPPKGVGRLGARLDPLPPRKRSG